MAGWKCTKCGWRNPWGTNDCQNPHCSTNYRSGRYWKCRYCGELVDENKEHCPDCGRDRDGRKVT